MICYDPQGMQGESSSFGNDPSCSMPESKKDFQESQWETPASGSNINVNFGESSSSIGSSQGMSSEQGASSGFDKEHLKQQALQTRDQVSQAVKTRASSFFDEQKGYVASLIHDVSSATRRCAPELEQNHPRLSEYTNVLADKMDNMGRSLQGRDMDYFVTRSQQFAKQHPTLFLGGALLLGFAAIRFLKSSSRSEQIVSQYQQGTATDQPLTTGIHNEVPSSSAGTQYTI